MRILRTEVACQFLPTPQPLLVARGVDPCGWMFMAEALIAESLILPSLPAPGIASWYGRVCYSAAATAGATKQTEAQVIKAAPDSSSAMKDLARLMDSSVADSLPSADGTR